MAAISKRIFLNENVWISIKISPKFVHQGPINDIPALVQIMAWYRPGDKPLSELIMVRLLTHICVTRPQWVKWFHRSGDRDLQGCRKSYNVEHVHTDWTYNEWHKYMWALAFYEKKRLKSFSDALMDCYFKYEQGICEIKFTCRHVWIYFRYKIYSKLVSH